MLSPQAREKESRAELTTHKESSKWKLLAAKRQADDVLPAPEPPGRQQLSKKRKATKTESHELGRVQHVELAFPAASVLQAGKTEIGEDLDAIAKEVRTFVF